MKSLRKLTGLLLAVLMISVFAVAANAAVTDDELSDLNEDYDIVFQIDLDRAGQPIRDLLDSGKEEEDSAEPQKSDETPVVPESNDSQTETETTPETIDVEENRTPDKEPVVTCVDTNTECDTPEVTCTSETTCGEDSDTPVSAGEKVSHAAKKQAIANTGDTGMAAVAAVSVAAAAAYVVTRKSRRV